jgi:hypothetical protein
MKRALCYAAALTAPLLFAAPAMAATTTPAGDGTGTPDTITTVHVPVGLYAEKDGPDSMGWLMTGGDPTSSFVNFSLTTFHADGSTSRIDIQATTPARALSTGGNLSSVTLSPTPVQVARQECTADWTCTSTTDNETLDLVATATGPVSAFNGSQDSRVSDLGKTVVAGASKTRPGTVTVHVGDLSWTATDDGWATASVQLFDSSTTYVNRGGPF